MVELDHVLLAVCDLDVAGTALAEMYGLPVIEGGVHPGWGTANRIVPLRDAYLELIAVVDAREASKTPFGRWVADGASDTGSPIGWAVRPRDLDATTQRLGLSPQEGSRQTPRGELLRWRSAGIEEAVREPSLPFFIEWALGTAYPGAISGDEPPSASISRLEIDGDPTALSAWLGNHSIPLRVSRGRPALRRVVLAPRPGVERAAGKGDGEIVLGEPSKLG